MRLLILVGVETGGRNESLRNLKTEDVDLQENKIELTNTKTGGSYTVPISRQLAFELERWIQVDREAYINDSPNPYLFPSTTGGKLKTGQSLNRLIKEAAKKADIQEVVYEREPTLAEREGSNVSGEKIRFFRVTAHLLRHTFSKIMEDEDIPIEARAAALDHNSVQTTREYYSYEQIDYHSFIRDLVYNETIKEDDDDNDDDRSGSVVAIK